MLKLSSLSTHVGRTVQRDCKELHMNRRTSLKLSGSHARRPGVSRFQRRIAVAAGALALVGMVNGIASPRASSAGFAEPALPATCKPITGPNHGSGDQYEVRFRMLRNCDDAVAAFRQIVGQTPPERPNNSPIRWWDVAGWKCEGGAGGRVTFLTGCERGESRLGFGPIPQAFASPTTILLGIVPDGVSDARILVNGSTLADEACVVSGPTVSFGGRSISKWMLTAKSPDSSIGCSLPQAWLARMVRQTGRGPSRALATAPRGWKCYAVVNGEKAVLGNCVKNGTGGKTSFGWAPAPN